MDMEDRLAELGPASPLSLDEAAAIHFYTQETPFYPKLNTLLRSRDRAKIKPFLPYLNLLITAMYKLIQRQGVKTRELYRGVKLRLADKFREGTNKCWWSVTSTTSVMVRACYACDIHSMWQCVAQVLLCRWHGFPCAECVADLTTCYGSIAFPQTISSLSLFLSFFLSPYQCTSNILLSNISSCLCY